MLAIRNEEKVARSHFSEIDYLLPKNSGPRNRTTLERKTSAYTPASCGKPHRGSDFVYGDPAAAVVNLARGVSPQSHFHAGAIMEPDGLFHAYRPGAPCDEARGNDGALQPHWRDFAGALAGPEELARRHDRLRRLVLENGIAHDLFAEPGARQPWSIDLIPLIIPAAEWAELEGGLLQRAALYERIVQDVYGPQTLLQSGKIPPRLVFSDPAYLHPCRMAPKDCRLIGFLAADLIRDLSGVWRVIDIHAETPAGLGFALANRLVHAEVMGDVAGVSQPLGLAPHFEALRNALLAQVERDDALIALLTPGPRHEDYFSHAYLARHLGFELLEGGDLQAAGGRVAMKTLEGLRPVDFIIRCAQGAQCDPLELDPDGVFGPPGFVQVLRKNPRLLANFLGGSIIENRGLAPSLPGLCQLLLGEDLRLDETRRRWLGDMEARVFVFAHQDRFVIRHAHEGTGRPGRGEPGLLLERLSAKELEAQTAGLEMQGQDYVAEERTDCATAPSWTPRGLEARPYALRLYVSGLDGEYRVMPGGLAMSLDGTPGVAMSAMDGHSRDVWVLSDAANAPRASLPRLGSRAASAMRSGIGLRSRVAQNLFELGRHAERADWILRLLRGALACMEESAAGAGAERALELLGLEPQQGAYGQTGVRSVENSVRSLLGGQGSGHNLSRTADAMLHAGGIVRERLSRELWRELVRFAQVAKPDAAEIADAGALRERLDAGIITLAALNGLSDENMTRTFGWHFLELGRRLERALGLAEILLALFGEVAEAEEAARLFFVLDAADSTITFRRRHLVTPVLPLVLDLLLMDEANPRGVGFQLAAVSSHLTELPRASRRGTLNEEERLILALHTRLRLLDTAALAQVDSSGKRSSLAEFLDHMTSELPRLADAISRRYFNQAEDVAGRVSTAPR